MLAIGLLLPSALAGQAARPDSAPARAMVVVGEVAHAATGRPIEGAAVLLVGTTIGSMTGASGRFALSVPLPDSARLLRVRRLGYESIDVRVALRTDADSLSVGRVFIEEHENTFAGIPGPPLCTFVPRRPEGVRFVELGTSTERLWEWVQEVRDPGGVWRLLHCKRQPGV